MKLSKYNLVLTAAFTGLTGGIAARAVQAPLVSFELIGSFRLSRRPVVRRQEAN